MADITIQIQNAKIQLNNIQSQFTNIETQMQNMGILSIGSQIKYLALQILNTGIQMLYIGMHIPCMNINEINFSEQIQDIKNQLQNFQLQQPNINTFNNSFNNFPFNDLYMKMNNCNVFNNNFYNNFNQKENKNLQNKIMNIIFKSVSGRIRIIVCDHGTTVNEVLEKFLRSIGKPEFINKEDVNYICNTGTIYGPPYSLKFGDETKIEDYFIDKNNNIITVSDTFHCPLIW